MRPAMKQPSLETATRSRPENGSSIKGLLPGVGMLFLKKNCRNPFQKCHSILKATRRGSFPFRTSRHQIGFLCSVGEQL